MTAHPREALRQEADILRQRAADLMRQAWKRTEVPESVWAKRTTHAFRHGIATHLRQVGWDKDTVEAWEGRDRGVHGGYVPAEDLDLKAVAADIPPPGGGVVTMRRKRKR